VLQVRGVPESGAFTFTAVEDPRATLITRF
jgi:hypothetical protein